MILKGISDRFELLVDRERREEAARIAVLYSRCIGAEGDPAFEEFPDVVSRWLVGESILLEPNAVPRCTRPKSILRTRLMGSFPADPDDSFDIINLSHGCGESRSTGQPPSSSFSRFGSESLLKSPPVFGSARAILEQLTHFSSHESDSERQVRVTGALRSTQRALALHPGETAIVAKIYSLLISIETGATRFEKVAALRACIADSPCACLAAAHDALVSSAISIASQVDLWESVASGGEALTLQVKGDTKVVSADPLRLYPPMRSGPHLKTAEGSTRWKSRSLKSTKTLTASRLAPLVGDFFTLMVYAPRSSSTLQFVDIARLRALASTIRLVTTTPNALTDWRRPIIKFSLTFVGSPFPETRALCWDVIASVGTSAQDPATRLQLRELLAHNNWDSAPLVKNAQARAFTSLSF
jgi:hypothetical protein